MAGQAAATRGFYEKLMKYFSQYPDSRPTLAVIAVLDQLGKQKPEDREWKNLLHEADIAKGRARVKLAKLGKLNNLSSRQLDRPAVIRGVGLGVGVKRIDVHWPKYKWGAPAWLVAAVARAAAAGFGGWYVARSSMFQWHAKDVCGEPYSAQCYFGKRTFALSPGVRRYDLERLRHTVFQNLMLVLDGFGPDDRVDAVRVQFYAAEISGFLGALLARPDGFHLAAQIEGEGWKKVAPCTFEFPTGFGLRRVRINDGSHPDGWVEFEVDGLRQSEREVRELRGGLADVSGAMQRQSAIVLEYAKQMALHLDVMRGIGANSKSQTDATEKLTKAVDEWCRLLAEKNKDDPAASQNSPAAKSADDRRRYM